MVGVCFGLLIDDWLKDISANGMQNQEPEQFSEYLEGCFKKIVRRPAAGNGGDKYSSSKD